MKKERQTDRRRDSESERVNEERETDRQKTREAGTET